MARSYNLFTPSETEFISDSFSDFGGWAVSGTRFIRRALTRKGPYRKYTPDSEYGTSLWVIPNPDQSGTVNSLTITSPQFTTIGGNTYNVSLAYASVRAMRYSISVVFYTAGNTAISSSTTYTTASITANSWIVGSSYFEAPDNAVAAEIKIVFDRTGHNPTTIGTGDTFAIYDPLVFDASSNVGRIAAYLYSDLPQYLRSNDLEISLIDGQLSYPLARYVESLSANLEKVSETVRVWSAEKSRLGDPDNANLGALRWLASLLGVATRSGYTSGSTTWADLEALDKDGDGNPGEWQDWEALTSWRELEATSVQNVLEETVLRPLVKTGGTGVHAGKTKNIQDLIVQSLEQEGATDGDVHIRRGPRKKLDSVQVYVKPSVDPGEGAVSGIVGISTGAGTEHEVVNSMIATASSCWMFENPDDALIRDVSRTADKARGSVNDDGGMGRHIVFATEANSEISAGGFIGTSTYTDGGAFYLGHGARLMPTANHSRYSMNGGDLEIIVCLSDLEPIKTSAYTGSTSHSTNEPEDWFFRDKRPIAFGVNGENWALFLASGLTPNKDNATRLLWVEDYITPRKANMAWSDPLPLGRLNNEGVWYLRVTRLSTQVDSKYPVAFYAQYSLQDNWSANALGTGSLDALDAAASSCRIVLGGVPLNSSGSNALSSGWAGKNSPKAAVATMHCIMFSKDADVFNARYSETDTESDTTVAIVHGEKTNARESVSYKTDLSLDFSDYEEYEIPEGYQFTGSADVQAASQTSYVVNRGQDYPVIAVPDGVEIAISSAGVSANSYVIRYVDNTGDEKTYTGSSIPTTDVPMPNNADLWTSSTDGPYFLRDIRVYSGSTLRSTLSPSDLEGGGFTFTSSNYARLTVSGIRYEFRTTSSSDPVRTPLTSNPILDVHAIDTNYLRPLTDAYILHPDPLLDKDEWSFLFHIRWNGTASDIVSPIFKAYLKDGTSEKRILDLRVRGDDIEATYARSFTIGGGALSTETVSYSTDVTNSVNRDIDWHRIVLRRKPSDGLSLWVDGVKRGTSKNSDVIDAKNPQNFNGAEYWRIQRGQSSYGSRILIGQSAYFDRWLTDNQIGLLEAEF